MESATIGCYQLPGSNGLNTAKNIKALLEEMKKNFPTGVDYKIGLDNTEYIQNSIDAVYHTIFEAVILVVIVMMVFLQSWRAAIIPLFAIPVSLIGTFFFMQLFGFSINNLSLFGLVLAALWSTTQLLWWRTLKETCAMACPCAKPQKKR